MHAIGSELAVQMQERLSTASQLQSTAANVAGSAKQAASEIKRWNSAALPVNRGED
jgi:chaperonin cofactor prefoldin